MGDKADDNETEAALRDELVPGPGPSAPSSGVIVNDVHGWLVWRGSETLDPD